MKKILLVMFTLSLCSCATVKTPTPISGSKSDGTVTLAYQYGAFEEPVIDWELAKSKAQKLCGAWGYHHAQAFGNGQSHCVFYDNAGCEEMQVDVMYQCS